MSGAAFLGIPSCVIAVYDDRKPFVVSMQWFSDVRSMKRFEDGMRRREPEKDEELADKFDLSVAMPRKRVGLVSRVIPDRRFGFITGEDFREEVFFHFDRFEPARVNQVPLEEMPVEFELDEPHRKETGKLRALGVRPTKRPVAKSLSGRDAPQFEAQHHPRSRRRKPMWRGDKTAKPNDLPKTTEES